MADPQGNPYDPTLQPAAGGQSEDMSQPSGLKRAWDSWTSRPENNAALISFGLNMMNPAPGNFLHGLGGAIGAGAETMSGNVKAQRERELEEQKSDIAEREEARKEEETGYYGQNVRSLAAQRGAAGGGAGGITPLKMWQARLRAASEFDKWANAEDVGMDPRFENVKKLHPEIKSKGDYLRSPHYQKDRQDYIAAHSAEPLAGMDLGGGGAPGGAGGNVPEGTIIRNKSNGHRMVMRNGGWEDADQAPLRPGTAE